MTRAAQAVPSATCHCGSVRIRVRRAPRTVTRCNCSICRRYGALWAYYGASAVQIEAPKGGLSSRGAARFAPSFAARCGCITHYKYRKKWGSGSIAINATNFAPEVLGGVRVRELDGASTWTWKYST